jgi:hypothetical protein
MMLAVWAFRFVLALVCAEGLLILTSADTIKIAVKRRDQRSPGETKRVSRGLFREFLAECFLFVPVSVGMAMIVLRPIVAKISIFPESSMYGLLGLISYGFPYKMLKLWVLRASVRFLKEAAAVADKQVLGESTGQEDL